MHVKFQDEYCEKYNDCLEQVESKRSFCVQLMNERKANQSHTEQSLISDVDECKIEHRRDMDAFKGLVLRKTEEYRNCLRSRISSAPAILDATKVSSVNNLIYKQTANGGDRQSTWPKVDCSFMLWDTSRFYLICAREIWVWYQLLIWCHVWQWADV